MNMGSERMKEWRIARVWKCVMNEYGQNMYNNNVNRIRNNLIIVFQSKTQYQNQILYKFDNMSEKGEVVIVEASNPESIGERVEVLNGVVVYK